MEIKLNAGDRLNIPANCKATIEDNQIIIEEQKEEFKDGDILKCIESDNIVVFKNRYKQTSAFRIYFSLIDESHRLCLYCSFRHATEEEKQAFFDELKAKGLRWNAETKTMEKFRERVEKEETYLTVDVRGGIIEVISFSERLDGFDNRTFNIGNYYLPEEREQAEEDAKTIRAIFEKRLKVKL